MLVILVWTPCIRTPVLFNFCHQMKAQSDIEDLLSFINIAAHILLVGLSITYTVSLEMVYNNLGFLSHTHPVALRKTKNTILSTKNEDRFFHPLATWILRKQAKGYSLKQTTIVGMHPPKLLSSLLLTSHR